MYINKNTCTAKTEVAVKFTLQNSIRRSRYVIIILHVANVFMHCPTKIKSNNPLLKFYTFITTAS